MHAKSSRNLILAHRTPAFRRATLRRRNKPGKLRDTIQALNRLSAFILESYIRHETFRARLCINMPPSAIIARPSGSGKFITWSMPLIVLNKPFNTICQFSAHESRPSLGDWVKTPGVYPAGRLDADSEGLLLLTDDGALQARISEPRHKLVKRYWAQVEGEPGHAALEQLAGGVDLGDYVTRPCRVERLEEPTSLWPRNPPIRFRAAIPTTWIELSITEGKNRQVRRMTAAVGYPTLRLVRVGIGALDVFALGLAPGASMELQPRAPWDGIA
jgi:23S rRNA pseudouridine2457 synthase